MKNPLRQGLEAFACFRLFRKYPGLFQFSDAFMQFSRVWLPARVVNAVGGRGMQKDLEVLSVDGNSAVRRIHLPEIDLSFFWPGLVDNNLFFMAEQEISSKNPHAYLTPPIRSDAIETLLDVGSCEGLFSFRAARLSQGPTIHCFEPSQAMGRCLLDGAVFNHVSEQIHWHPFAVGNQVGSVRFVPGPSSDAGAVIACQPQHPEAVQSITLDQFLADKAITLQSGDLIKIDAEGSDLDVILGAEATIRQCKPQIAVTTYHCDEHAEAIYSLLKQWVPDYRFRLKGFSFWTEKPRPVLLQASCLD